MAFGSGLAAQLGYGAETTVGTQVVVDHFIEHDEAKLALKQKWAAGEGLRAGGQVQRATRLVPTTRAAAGSIKADVASVKFGMLIRHMLGSPITVPTLISGAAYKQVHQLGNAALLGLTLQVGRPQVDGTVKPFAYPGAKISGWELSCSEGDLLSLNLDIDAKDELTLVTSPASNALAAATYVAATEVFNFTQCVIKIGGTASTASSVVSIAGNAAATQLIRSFKLKAATPLAADRYGTSATKREQLQNGYSTPVLSLDSEFGLQSELYDVFRAGTVLPVQFTFTGSLIAGANYNSIDIILAATKITAASAEDKDKDLTGQPLELQVLDDGTNNPCQITVISTEATM